MMAKYPLTVSPTTELQQFIAQRVASGLSGSASKVVRQAFLRCLRERGGESINAVKCAHAAREPAHAR